MAEKILDLKQSLWAAADKLRNNMSPADYKYVVLGLIFLKYISDAFSEQYAKAEKEGFDPEDRDFYTADNVFWVPKEARWKYIQGSAKQATVGVVIDAAMDAVERDNTILKGVLPRNYARESLDKRRLGELVDLFSNISLKEAGHSSKDLLGEIYEYFIGMFADAEGKRGGEFFTPKSIVELLVNMLEPYKGRIYDPCCGSGGMFSHSSDFVKHHAGRIGDLAIYGQESNDATYKLARMNMAIRGIDADIRYGDTLHNDQHKDLKADFIIANPPFNISDWGAELLKDDVRWKFGVPPSSNANFAWVQHFIHHLSSKGNAGFVLSNSSLSAERTGEVDIRSKIIEEDLIDCIVVLPNNLFFNTPISACLWFLSRDKDGDDKVKERKGEMLFIDARKFGHMEDKTHRLFSKEEISHISGIYHNWKTVGGDFKDIPRLCKTVNIDRVKGYDFSLSPNLYIDLVEGSNSSLSVNKRIDEFASSVLYDQDEKKILESQIKKAFMSIGYQELARLDYSNVNYKQIINLVNNIFEKWFINFELPSTIQQVKFVETGNEDTPLLPEGWRLEKLISVAEVTDCLHSKKPNRLDSSEFKLLEVNNISSEGLLDLTDTYYISSEDYVTWTRNTEVTEGDCVITNTGRVGAVAQIPKSKKFAIGRNMTAVRADKKLILPSYLLSCLLSQYMKNETYRKTDIGTILDSLNVKGIKKIILPVPPFEIQEAFDKFATPLRRLIEIGAEN